MYLKTEQIKVKSTKKKKSPSLSKVKKRAWDMFSKYIRTRDCLLTTNTTTHGKCVTCKKVYEFKQLHAGHFIPGRKNANLFDELGCHGQCGVCNMWLKGNPIEYWLYMEKTYGRETIDELILRNKQIRQYSIKDFEELYQLYKLKLENLCLGQQ